MNIFSPPQDGQTALPSLVGLTIMQNSVLQVAQRQENILENRLGFFSGVVIIFPFKYCNTERCFCQYPNKIENLYINNTDYWINFIITNIRKIYRIIRTTRNK